MKPIATKQIQGSIQKRIKEDMRVLMGQAVSEMRGILLRYADANGKIPVNRQGDVKRECGDVIQRIMVGNSRQAFSEQGSAQSDYARMLNLRYVQVVTQVVRKHQAWMQKHLPEDVYQYLRRAFSQRLQFREQDALAARRAAIEHGVLRSKITENVNPYAQRLGESNEDYRQRLIDQLRIFRPNPLAELDENRQWVPMHKWTDGRGYRLADRVWEASDETRKKINEVLAKGLALGQGALELAAALEAYVVPTETGKRKLKPYGKRFMPDGAAYAAMRLARTEIARAANQAAFTSAYLNPYVAGMDVARSSNGDKNCKVCPMHASIDISGRRVRPAYGMDSVPIPPFHPHDMCRVESVPVDSPQAVTQQLRELMQQPEFTPSVTPAQADTMIEQMLGTELAPLLGRTQQRLL